MMFQEIEQLLATGARLGKDLKQNVVDDNVLGKKTGNTRVLTWRHLASLYGLDAQPAITKVFLAFGPRTSPADA